MGDIWHIPIKRDEGDNKFTAADEDEEIVAPVSKWDTPADVIERMNALESCDVSPDIVEAAKRMLDQKIEDTIMGSLSQEPKLNSEQEDMQNNELWGAF